MHVLPSERYMTDVKEYSSTDGGQQAVTLYRGLISISLHV